MRSCHHDDLVLDERDERLMRSFLKWVDTARKTYGPEWEPSPIDVCKSRLFWWIRSGHEPLPSPPPTAYSCPWYELVTEEGPHSSFEGFELDRFADTFFAAQCAYKIIERISESELIVGLGPYRFRAFRNPELYIETMIAQNGGREEVREMLTEIAEEATKAWYLERCKDKEDATAPLFNKYEGGGE